MNIQYTFKNITSTESIKNQAKIHAEKLLKYTQGDVHANWVFYVEGDTHVADLQFKGSHFDFYGQAKTENLYDSIDQAILKVEKQLRKYKEKLKDHLHKDRSTKKAHLDDSEE